MASSLVNYIPFAHQSGEQPHGEESAIFVGLLTIADFSPSVGYRAICNAAICISFRFLINSFSARDGETLKPIPRSAPHVSERK
jgi:hypothetical protein